MTTPVDQDVLGEFLAHAIGDLGATFSAGLVVLGDRLGLYRELSKGPGTVEELAARTGTALAYLSPWLANQAAGGYIGYDAATGRYVMSPEQTLALADEDGPAFFPGGMQLALAVLRDLPEIERRFRTGEGFGWHEHDPGLFEGTERFFRPGCAANLVHSWLPALDGMTERLTRGASVADVGCGHGTSTILMAQAYPMSTFLGVDYHEGSVRWARRHAAEAGLSDRVAFETAGADELPGGGYDLITFFDCLHDVGDPVGAARRAREALNPDGAVMIVEPLAGDSVADNLNPLGRVFYGVSVLVCTPCSLAQAGAAALGPQAGPARIAAVLREAGFGAVRIAAQAPANLVYEARP
jgi:SAM-dependent methyltransferase